MLIGPVNYWFLWRQRQQVLLVLTAPLISAIFIVLLAGYVLAGEGFGVRGRAATFTLLDQVRKQAVHARQHLAVRRRHDAGGRLALPSRRGGVPDRPRRDRHPRPRDLDLTDSQRFSAGVIQARSTDQLRTNRIPARARTTELQPRGDGMTVVNGLGATVARLVYRDGDTVRSRLTLPPGGKAL